MMSRTLLSDASRFSSIVLIKRHWVLSNYSIDKWMNPVELFGKRQKQSGIGREEDTRGWGGGGGCCRTHGRAVNVLAVPFVMSQWVAFADLHVLTCIS